MQARIATTRRELDSAGQGDIALAGAGLSHPGVSHGTVGVHSQFKELACERSGGRVRGALPLFPTPHKSAIFCPGVRVNPPDPVEGQQSQIAVSGGSLTARSMALPMGQK
jgi:hypothetical protein